MWFLLFLKQAIKYHKGEKKQSLVGPVSLSRQAHFWSQWAPANTEATSFQTTQPIHSMKTVPIPHDNATQYHWQNTEEWTGCLSLIYMAKDMKNRS